MAPLQEHRSINELVPIDSELSSAAKNLSNIKSDHRINEEIMPSLKHQLNKSVEYRPRENKTIDVVEGVRDNSDSRKGSLQGVVGHKRGTGASYLQASSQ